MTAKDVRVIAEALQTFCEDVNGNDAETLDPAYAALTAYADRLEQDEQTLKACAVFTVESVYVVNPPFSERELGRREVYREIAAIDPCEREDGSCRLCFHVMNGNAAWESEYDPKGNLHAKGCLYLRATASLRETTPTP